MCKDLKIGFSRCGWKALFEGPEPRKRTFVFRIELKTSVIQHSDQGEKNDKAGEMCRVK